LRACVCFTCSGGTRSVYACVALRDLGQKQMFLDLTDLLHVNARPWPTVRVGPPGTKLESRGPGRTARGRAMTEVDMGKLARATRACLLPALRCSGCCLVLAGEAPCLSCGMSIVFPPPPHTTTPGASPPPARGTRHKKNTRAIRLLKMTPDRAGRGISGQTKSLFFKLKSENPTKLAARMLAFARTHPGGSLDCAPSKSLN
jgi:hypothetical protein